MLRLKRVLHVPIISLRSCDSTNSI